MIGAEATLFDTDFGSECLLTKCSIPGQAILTFTRVNVPWQYTTVGQAILSPEWMSLGNILQWARRYLHRSECVLAIYYSGTGNTFTKVNVCWQDTTVGQEIFTPEWISLGNILQWDIIQRYFHQSVCLLAIYYSCPGDFDCDQCGYLSVLCWHRLESERLLEA